MHVATAIGCAAEEKVEKYLVDFDTVTYEFVINNKIKIVRYIIHEHNNKE